MVARELDIAAGIYLHNEQMKLEAEREKRDREFWMALLGGKSESDGSQVFTSGEGIKVAMPGVERW